MLSSFEFLIDFVYCDQSSEFLLWQEIAVNVGGEVQKFLEDKYGIVVK